MRAAVQERSLQVILGMIQAGALERVALGVVRALRAPVRAGAIECDVVPAPNMDEEDIDLAAFVDDSERGPGLA